MTDAARSASAIRWWPRSRNLRKDGRLAARNVVALALTLPFLYPFYFLIITAFKSNKNYASNQLGLPHPVVLTQFTSAWQSASLGRSLLNSTIAAGIGALVTIVLSAPAADWCARTRSRGKSVVLGTVACIWMIPMIIWIIPMFVELSRAHMTNNLLVLGVIYGVTNTPLGLYLLYAYLADAVPGEIREAAVVAGAKPRHVFFMISLPISVPVLATIAVLAFVWSWGDVLIAAVLLQSQSDWTVTLAATSFVSRYGVSIQQEAAAAIISMLPMVVIFAVGQRGIVKGLTVGSGR
jgi:raffinose/stachyose/melibiose transport system permease protein